MNNWRKLKLGDCLKFYNGKTISVQEAGDYPIYGANGIIGFTDKATFNNAIVIGRVGAYCGATVYEPNGFWASDNTIVVTGKNGFDNGYMAYLLKIINLNWFSGGSAQPLVTQGWIKPIKVDVPNFSTQKTISAILSAYDDLIENNLARIKLLEEMAQITYEEWFVRMQFPGHETAEINPDTDLPEGWIMSKLGNVLGKVPKTKKLKSDSYLDNGAYPIIDQSRDFIAGYTNDKDAILELECPAIVFGDHTRIVKLINFNFARGADGTQILISNEERMPQHLLYLSVLNIDLSDYHYARHFKYLKDSEILLPCLSIASKFEAKIKSIFDLVKTLRDQNNLLKEARDILLPRLMTGMIDIEKVELPDALLARIQANGTPEE